MRNMPRKRQRGFTIYESVAAVAIGGTIIAGLTSANISINRARLVTKTINENRGQRNFQPDAEMKPEMRKVLQRKKEDF